MSGDTHDFVATWKGRPATELTREELLIAYTRACKELHDMRQRRADDSALLDEIRHFANRWK